MLNLKNFDHPIHFAHLSQQLMVNMDTQKAVFPIDLEVLQSFAAMDDKKTKDIQKGSGISE